MALDPKIVEKRLGKVANYVGFSLTPKPRIRDGKIVPGTSCLRVYVKRKVPKELLSPNDIIPEKIGDVEVDVVAVGELRALARKRSEFDPKTRHRPICPGISVAVRNITAGTLDILFEKGGITCISSNSHVFLDNPSKTPEEVTVKEILQPGPYDQGHYPDDWVADYYWHKRVVPKGGGSTCPAAKLWAGVYNFFAWLLGAKTRLTPVVEEKNKIDFAVATLKEGISFDSKVWSQYEPKNFVGLLFAGSDTTTIICKVKHVQEEGWNPVGVTPTEVQVGDILEKFGRTTGRTEGPVTDESAVVDINYESFIATFEDIIVVGKPNFSAGGDSGSAVWRK
jgi:hypothetical protein